MADPDNKYREKTLEIWNEYIAENNELFIRTLLENADFDVDELDEISLSSMGEMNDKIKDAVVRANLCEANVLLEHITPSGCQEQGTLGFLNSKEVALNVRKIREHLIKAVTLDETTKPNADQIKQDVVIAVEEFAALEASALLTSVLNGYRSLDDSNINIMSHSISALFKLHGGQDPVINLMDDDVDILNIKGLLTQITVQSIKSAHGPG